VERDARRDPSVAAIETVVPSSGPPAGATHYVKLRFKRGGSITVTQWPDRQAASNAAGRYESTDRHLSIGLLGTTLEVLSVVRVGPSELQPFQRCGVGRP